MHTCVSFSVMTDMSPIRKRMPTVIFIFILVIYSDNNGEYFIRSSCRALMLSQARPKNTKANNPAPKKPAPKKPAPKKAPAKKPAAKKAPAKKAPAKKVAAPKKAAAAKVSCSLPLFFSLTNSSYRPL